MYARRSDSRTTIGAAVAVAIAAQVTPGSAAAKPRAPSSFLEKFGFQGAQLLLGDEQAEVALRGTLKLAHLGTPAAQRRLASVVAGRGAQWSGGIWLALVRALFASNGAADGLHVSLRRTLTEHIRTERVGNGKQLQLGLLSQSCAARGLATSRSTEDRRVLDEVIRGGGNGAKIVKRALGAEDESQPLSRRQALAGSGRRRDTLELLGELKGTQAPLAAEALLGSADPGIDELLARGQLGQSAWARRLQMARAIVNGQGLPTISTETGKRAGGEWSSSEREEIGQWAAAWNDKTWGMNALRSNDPRQIARLASKVNWLSQEVLDEAARRLELLPEEPLRTMLGFSLANGRAAALLSSHTLVELAHEGQNLRDLAFRELSRRVNTRVGQ